MAEYAQAIDLRPRIGGRDLDATSDPSIDDVERWIDGAESELLATLAISSITPSTDDTTRAHKIINEWLLDYAEGRFRSANAAAGGDGDNEDGEKQIERWEARLKDMRTDSSHYDALLTGGAAGTSSSQVRGSMNIDAQFTREEKF